MAVATFIDNADFRRKLDKMPEALPDISKAALKAGANIIADEMKKNLKAILQPESRNGELVAAFGITPMKTDRKGVFNVHLGFDGYQLPAAKNFPNGVPFQLLARTFESGAVLGSRYQIKDSGTRTRSKRPRSQWAYWREPTPFAAPAVRAKWGEAETKMREIAETELERILNDGKSLT